MSKVPTVTVSRRGAQRIVSGHPWVFRSDLQKVASASGGEAVRVVDGRGWFQGFAFYSAKSQIALRILTREDVSIDEAFFAGRIARAVELRRSMFPDAQAVRLVHGEADQLPGLIADRYGSTVVIQLLNQAADSRRELFARLLLDASGASAALERSDAKVRSLEGLEARKGALLGQPPSTVTVAEGDVVLEVELLGGQKTGAFLDQRENRLAAAGLARGRCLDCFAYSGAFAVHLARRAESVLAVEINEAAAAKIARNAALNGLANVEAAVANAFDRLSALAKAGDRFDMVVLDPPAFAKSKTALPAAERGYKEINLRAFQILRPGGVLVTSSCSFHLSEQGFEAILEAAARDARRQVQVIERRGASRDHPVLLSLPETRYLKCWFLRAL